MTRTAQNLFRIVVAVLLCAAVSACTMPAASSGFPSQVYSAQSVSTPSTTSTSIMDY